MHENKEKSLFKNKGQMILYLLLFCLFMGGFVFFGTRDYSKKILVDNEHFNEDYPLVGLDNVFKYVNAPDALSSIKSKNTIILLGTTNNDYVGTYAKILNEVAKDLKINSINYYDFTIDRENQNDTYKTIVYYLKDYVYYLDGKTADLYAPTFIVKKDGIMLLFDDETALIKGSMSPEKYYTEYQIGLKRNTLKAVLTDYLKEETNGK